MSENTSGGILNPFVLFFVLIIGFVKAIEYAWLAVTVWSTFFLYLHEAMHLGVAYVLGVRSVDQGYTDDAYEIEFEAHTPEQGFFISFAPMLLAPVAFLLMYFAFNTPLPLFVSVPVFVVAFGIAMQSMLSDLDSFSTLIQVSRVSPVSSIVSSVIALPFAVLYLPAILLRSTWVFFVQFLFASGLAYIAHSVHIPFLTSLITWGVPL